MLALEMQTAPSGRRLMFRVSGGRPGNAAAIHLTRIGSQPTETVIHLGDLDGSGAMEISLPVPGSWRGEVGFTCEAVGRCVRRVTSEEVDLRV